MAVKRPTFSESWYRVENLKPRLRTTTQIFRQHYRGQMWFVVRDPSNNQFFRLNESAYHFLGLLDGKRTVSQVWETCSEHLGDKAPTQNEAIQLLGQLYSSNLLQADLPADTESMFERYRKRIRKEISGYMTNFLFPRIPLYDPEHFLERWVGVFGHVFSLAGFIAWIVMIGFAFTQVIPKWGSLFDAGKNVLDPSNLFMLFICFWCIKLIHEFGHGFACKKFGKDTNTGGEVHTMGIMFLVFTPIPYVDASSSWAFRNSMRRMMVALAGMYVELFVAAIAACVWAWTSSGELIHGIAYNVIFVASLSTILFNANPLLRYDGYYILSDLLEIPNLQQRGKQYIYYLVKKYVYKVRDPRNPAHTRGEAIWMFFYTIAATCYRVFISVAIVMFVADKLFFVGMIMAVAAIVGWLMVPLGKFVHYLATSGELTRTRPRAIFATVLFFAVVFGGIGLIPVEDHGRAEGVIEPRHIAVVYMNSSGFIDTVLPSGEQVQGSNSVLVSASNIELEVQYEMLKADRKLAVAKERQARVDEIAVAQQIVKQIAALDHRIARVEQDIEDLKVFPPHDGQWISPEIDRSVGAYVQRGKPIGLVASIDDLIIRAVVDQKLGPRVERELKAGAETKVEIKVRGRPDDEFVGTISRILDAGQKNLPSAALGYMAGGSTEVTSDDPQGTKTKEQFFEMIIDPTPVAGDEMQADAVAKLLSGQRVIVRFTLESKPLGKQWFLMLHQMVQRRFGI